LGWLQAFPSVFLGDAWAYHTYALKFRENGFLSDFGSIRPYGYPAFLYLVSFLGLRNIPLYAGLFQYSMFLTFTLWLARQVRVRNRNLSSAILVGLLLNPFIISIVVDCFSEGLLIPIFVLLTCLAIKAGKAHSVAGLLGPLSLGALAASFALVVRPAALPIVLAWTLSASIAIVCNSWLPPRECGSAKRLGMNMFSFPCAQAALLYAVLFALAALISWGPQLYYNYKTWHTISLLPVCRLDEVQVYYSIAMLRYDTLVYDSSAEQFFYRNPFSNADVVTNHPIHWYLENFLSGLGTILLRLIAGFNVDHLFTHVHVRAQKLYRPILPLAYWTVICLGLARAWQLFNEHLPQDREQWYSKEYGAATIFVLTSILATAALNSITAIELRFNAFAIGGLCVLGIDAFLRPNRPSQRLKVALYAFVAGSALAICSEMMMWTYGTAGPLESLPQVTLSPLKCYTFASEAP
jgi:hypothetical protein